MRLPLLALLVLTGCASPSGTITLPMLPLYEAPTDSKTFTGQQVAFEAQRLVPLAQVTYDDNLYSFVSFSWLQKFLEWEWKAAQADGIIYTPESFDCEDFAMGFRFFANRAAARAGVKTSPMIARVTVSIPAGLHKVNGVVTDKGIFIVEPQLTAGAFRMIELTKFTGTILKIEL